jgi:two-component system cell cycle response regulator CpdR
VASGEHWKILTGARISAITSGMDIASGTIMIRILLAEDDDAMRVYLARALEKSGYSVVSCDRGTTALEHVDSGEKFDLLLTDIVMPEMDGIELAQKVAISAPEMRVMFITGFSAVTLRAGQALPQAKVLSKPFHLRDLVLEVDRMFEDPAVSEL